MTEGREPTAVFLLNQTPADLRALADRIDAKLKQAQPGQHVLTEVSDKITKFTVTIVTLVNHNGTK